jgi:hypothetical protein
MSDYTGKNIFEKIGSFIPGYKGYSEKEGRKDTDKLIRMEIAKHLDGSKADIDIIIREQMYDKNTSVTNELDRIKKKLDLVSNQIRFANYGESGFFDVLQVGIADLDRLYQFDLRIKEETEELVSMIKTLRRSENLKKDCSSIIEVLSALSEKISSRDKVIMEVR